MCCWRGGWDGNVDVRENTIWAMHMQEYTMEHTKAWTGVFVIASLLCGVGTQASAIIAVRKSRIDQ